MRAILHPMTDALRPDLEAQFDVGHAPRGGDAYTINATGGTDNQTAGGSFKIVSDTENWDNSVGLNNPGQSGDVDDPALSRSLRILGAGKIFPDLLFARESGKRGGKEADAFANTLMSSPAGANEIRAREGDPGPSEYSASVAPSGSFLRCR